MLTISTDGGKHWRTLATSPESQVKYTDKLSHATRVLVVTGQDAEVRYALECGYRKDWSSQERAAAKLSLTCDRDNADVKLPLTKQEQFFYDHAGYSVAQGETKEQGHERSAKALAAAETWAAQNGYTFDCDPDRDADESFMDDEPQEYQDEWRGTAWYMAMIDPDGHVVQSLGGCFGYSDYKRVVRAELALEEMPSEVVA